MVEFGATLARLRRNTGKTTTTLARTLNVDPVYLERLERGDGRAPDRQFVLDVARALELSEPQTDELLWSANHLPLRAQTSDPREPRAVALFVDHENVYIALNELLKSLPPDVQAQERRKIDPSSLALTLRSAAEQIGWIKTALAIADWERLPAGQVKEYLKLRYQIDYNLPGRNNADLKLTDAIRNALEDDAEDEIDTYVLVTGDGGYLTILDTLLRRQKQVHVWGVRGTMNGVLQQNASACAWVEDLVGLPAAPPEKPVAVAVDGPRAPLVGNIGNDVTRLEALAIHLSRYLRQRSWTFITFVRFLNFLAESGVFGASREEQLAWLSHAKETGVLREEIVDDPSDPTRIARRFSLNEEHPLVIRAQAIRQRVGETVPSGGRGLAFGVVIDRLISDPELQLTDVQAKNWLTWLTEANYLQSEQVPHFRKEGVTVTLLRLNPTNWDTPVAEVGEERAEIAAEAATVRLANFLERHPHFAWMALSQLLNHMSESTLSSQPAAAPNRQRAKQAIAAAQEIGLLIVEQIPNLKTGGATTVARLNREAQRVHDLLTLRDTLVRRLAEMLVSRPSISRAAFQTTLVDRVGLGYEEAGAWIDLLASEGLFIQDLDHDGAPGVLRVDHQDLIVSRILFGALQSTTT
ncbi:MAG TPA: helix-turn-helix domain-containing protein [Chloroflexota bacterium]|nr:helix-turn-helix domain-containing protein [Chloroflexota bacterium]